MNSRSGKRLASKIRGAIAERQPKLGINPFSTFVESLCEVRRVAARAIPRPLMGPTRVALVSMPRLRESDLEFRDFFPASNVLPKGVDRDDSRRSLVSLRQGIHKRFFDAYTEALTYCVDHFGANVICVSELGLPNRNVLPMANAQKFAYELSAKKNVLVVAGTAHDGRTQYNTGYLYHPGGSWAFHKTLSATSMGERIASPAVRRVLTIKTLGLRIAVLICLDVADYATFASLIRVADKVDLVLVPCYTEKFDKMLEVAKVASRALPGIVALVNGHVPNAISHIARFGEDEEPVRRHEFQSEAVASLFEINHDDFQAERIRHQNSADRAEIDWLFGSRDLPHLLASPRPTA